MGTNQNKRRLHTLSISYYWSWYTKTQAHRIRILKLYSNSQSLLNIKLHIHMSYTYSYNMHTWLHEHTKTNTCTHAQTLLYTYTYTSFLTWVPQNIITCSNICSRDSTSSPRTRQMKTPAGLWQAVVYSKWDWGHRTGCGWLYTVTASGVEAQNVNTWFTLWPWSAWTAWGALLCSITHMQVETEHM